MKTLILDPGHGLKIDGKYSRPLLDCRGDKIKFVPRGMRPHKSDHEVGFYREDFGTLQICKEIKEILKGKVNVLLTRNDDKDALTYLSSLSTNEWEKKKYRNQKWRWIVNFTNNNNADLFISVHSNAAGGSGIRSFWESTPNGICFSESVCDFLQKEIKIKPVRIKKHRYLILRNNCQGRSILLETLFHDNIEEVQLMLSEEGRKKIATGISNGILDYISKIN